MDLSKLSVFRIIAIENLQDDLINGLYSKRSAPNNPNRVAIGNKEIIQERDNRIVKCYTNTFVNDYVPFYFSNRTPMLYNIKTGHGVDTRPQEDIIYLCYKYVDLATVDFQWCFTDGNAAKKITKFFKEHADLKKLDWKSIRTTDFRTDNLDGDEDRIRKKHSEFLVLNKVPSEKIAGIVVLNKNALERVKYILESYGLNVKILIKPNFYF
jgi:hypothetical protein